MKLIIKPADGVGPLLTVIRSAKRSVEIAVFRFDRKDIETALCWCTVLHDKDVKDTMRKVVKKAVKEAVKEAVEDAQDVKEA